MTEWSTETGRKALLKSFINGFCACRDEIDAGITPGSYGFYVEFRHAAGRRGEVFACDAFPADLLQALKPDEWLTVLGDPDRVLPRGQGALSVLADELFMIADISALEQSPEAAEAYLLSSADQIAAFNASGEAYPFEPNDRAFLFAVIIGGSIAATARYGVADAGDIVVDRVATAPAFRRRGLARRIMTAIAAHAARQGHRRALLISSKEGEALYRSLDYQPITPVRVFAIDRRD